MFTKIAAIILWLSSGDESGGYEDHRGPWQRYLRLLPQMEDLTNLISFSPAERLCLQIPELMVRE